RVARRVESTRDTRG
ncbi:hypothetical protein BVRB_014310, partial [Beta vulgaris subsp. vulgaris]